MAVWVSRFIAQVPLRRWKDYRIVASASTTS